MSVTLAIDAMGGDHGVIVTVPACCDFLEKHPDVRISLVGDSEKLKLALKPYSKTLVEQIQIIPASEIVLMDDPIEVALRRKKDSSMRVAIEQVKEGLADAVISSGNTGALMAISRYVLKTLDGVDRPAIATAIPNELGRGTTMLDLGANADCEPMHLLQFAQMASVMVQVVDGKDRPSIGLLNIGEEVIKGNEVVKQTAELLRASKLNFYGNVEGNDIFKGTTDIVVCDGFVGNVVLKASEGLAKMMSGLIREEFNRSLMTKIMATFAMVPLLRVRKRVDHRRYNGAVLLGLRGCVIKSHGSADRFAFGCALDRAYEAAKNKMVERIAQDFVVETKA
ncbi:phosphate acyltransferase PlsX [Polynucleobacter paneuropaeus]|jgi:glycerol-3-phosphate acyltransferase PlsX|uniref:Phosphate acyltransferase n=1 Tax=Polynucleobacter paneuropaeus TaxID=2527775 RepID=A0AAE2YM06_9BURK|nr:phosphate acyltransferase PlsX [Polynucleobacter paneuropaeus]AWW48281.1 phosphate acyltransferase PlsX [Polynucleobacter paneuropaeus]MBT8514605.1 phosphate acyltransferase PlsX [Polynucleobacter paneuropaeus]MBT8516452.1 phosphate acyltransferase PlsX [Polynucleobacter paneuropaeus]MBT8527655.1 phosphate acyltransferase PlsX [Polynucleobacter paneuropaeus]MBT8530128.1 phosphate acyltransferase PlsX [Polynucleobacter paneuropaeus]